MAMKNICFKISLYNKLELKLAEKSLYIFFSVVQSLSVYFFSMRVFLILSLILYLSLCLCLYRSHFVSFSVSLYFFSSFLPLTPFSHMSVSLCVPVSLSFSLSLSLSPFNHLLIYLMWLDEMERWIVILIAR